MATDDQWSPPDADFKDADWSPPASDFSPVATTQEKSDGPMGFINGVAGAVGKGILNVPYAAAHGVQDLYRRVSGGDTDAPDSGVVNALHVPLNENEKNVVSSVGETLKPYKDAAVQVAKEDLPIPESESEFLKTYVAPVATDVASIAPAASAVKGATSVVRGAARAADAAPVLAGPQQSLSAAATAPDLSVAHPELRAAIDATPSPHPVALERHLDTAQLPLPEGSTPLQLRKGQATGDAQQISDEKNLRADPDTQGVLSKSITDQDQKLVDSMGEIRRSATPDIVQRTNAEHGQAAVDAIKAADNASVLDIRAKYKALTDANGGSVPINTGTAIDGIDAQLKKKYLTKTAQDSGVISSVMDDLRSGNPMDFESFENARSGLAALQRTQTPEGVAAGIVHSALEEMPLSAAAAPLKDLADTARSAAKARFDTIKQNPAYDAAINDNVPKKNGLHVIGSGADSPLADSFMDRYALGNGQTAAKAYVDRLKAAVPDPVLHQSIEAATLNKLRDAAGIDVYGNGSFRNASYGNARNALAPKIDSLVSPASVENTARLKRVSNYVNDEGKASSTNRSNTGLTLQRFGAIPSTTPSLAGELANYGGDVAAAHVGPIGSVGKAIGQSIFKNRRAAKEIQALRDAKLKFALDATKPGAGLDYVPPAAPARQQRASGGKVDHEVLVNRLMNRWKAAKKETDKTTKPLLDVPDHAIVKALDIAGAAI